MFTYSGWNAAAYVAEEIRDPGRNVPLALGARHAGGRRHLSRAERALSLCAADRRARRAARRPADRRRGRAAVRLRRGNLLAIFTIVSIAASISAMVLAGPRVYYAMARDGVFLPAAAACIRAIARRCSRSPRRPCGAACSCCPARCRSSSRTRASRSCCSPAIAVLALFVLRRRDPGAERPFNALGYPVAPALFVLASLVMVVNEIWNNPGTRYRPAVIAAGLPLYLRARASPCRDCGAAARDEQRDERRDRQRAIAHREEQERRRRAVAIVVARQTAAAPAPFSSTPNIHR